MLVSISILIITAIVLAEISSRIGLPSLVGMIAAGMIVGPHGCDLLSDGLLAVAVDLRTFALVIILTRAGLSMDLDLLRRSGRVALLLSTLPALFEIAAIVVIAPILFGISYIDAAIMGCVVAAVSPAIIVPRMIELIDKGRGKGVAQVIMTAASMDDLLVIVLFSIFMKMGGGGEFSPSLLLDLPLSLFWGVVVGVVVGYLLSQLFRRYSLRDTLKVTLMISITLMLMGLEQILSGVVPYSPLLSIIAIGAIVGRRNEVQAQRISHKYGKVWQIAQLLLFSLVGAEVDIHYAWQSGIFVIVALAFALVWRFVAVWLSTQGSGFSREERLFCMLSTTPKATVQAAIGSIPLSMGLASGELILSMAVVAILITAPIGAYAIDWGAKRL